jgi:hypothetical protein
MNRRNKQYKDYSLRKLNALPELPQNLELLDCHKNVLTQLPELPPKLEDLNCSNNLLTQLPELPQNLELLDCHKNVLTQLPELPPKLEDLNCSNNLLTQLPELPVTLKDLDCHKNKLTVLPELPPELEDLNCSDNELISISLHTITTNSFILKCRNNPIRNINIGDISDLTLIIDIEGLDIKSLHHLKEKNANIKNYIIDFQKRIDTIILKWENGEVNKVLSNDFMSNMIRSFVNAQTPEQQKIQIERQAKEQIENIRVQKEAQKEKLIQQGRIQEENARIQEEKIYQRQPRIKGEAEINKKIDAEIDAEIKAQQTQPPQLDIDSIHLDIPDETNNNQYIEYKPSFFSRLKTRFLSKRVRPAGGNSKKTTCKKQRKTKTKTISYKRKRTNKKKTIKRKIRKY